MSLRETLKLDLGTLLRGKSLHETERWAGPRPRRRDVRAVIDQMRMLVRTNADLPAGLDVAATDAARWPVREVLLALSSDMMNGLSLTEAFQRRRRFFPAFCIDMIAAGERTGKLPEAVDAIAEELNTRHKAWQYIRQQLAYFFVLVIPVLMVFLVGTFIFGQLAEITGEFGMPAPPALRVFLKIKSTLGIAGVGARLGSLDNGINQPPPATAEQVMTGAFVVLVVLLVVGWLYLRRPRVLTGPMAEALRFVPGIAAYVKKANAETIARLLRLQFDAGTPAEEAFAATAEAGVAPAYRRALRRIGTRVTGGQSITDAFRVEHRLFPKGFIEMVALGDASGMMPTTLGHVSRLYRDQVRTWLRILVDTVVPAAVVLTGLTVLVLELALFQSLTGIFDVLMRNM